MWREVLADTGEALPDVTSYKLLIPLYQARLNAVREDTQPCLRTHIILHLRHLRRLMMCTSGTR
jgi:hypothetical protein